MTQYQKSIYKHGYNAAKNDDVKVAPMFHDKSLKWFWLGGYSDYELEHGL